MKLLVSDHFFIVIGSNLETEILLEERSNEFSFTAVCAKEGLLEQTQYFVVIFLSMQNVELIFFNSASDNSQ